MVLAHAVRVATLRQKIAAERKVRELLAQDGVPEPDEVEYGYTCIRLLWHEPKVALVVDIDPPADDAPEFEPERNPADSETGNFDAAA
jgi:hypothetical protein